jgi:hypothetical protein
MPRTRLLHTYYVGVDAAVAPCRLFSVLVCNPEGRLRCCTMTSGVVEEVGDPRWETLGRQTNLGKSRG